MATKKILLDWSETGSTVYGIVERDTDNALLNDADGSFSTGAVADPYWSLTEHSIIKGRYSATRSDDTWADGLHTFAIYDQSGTASVPASDIIIGTGSLFIVSDAEVVLDKSVASLNDLSTTELATQFAGLNDISTADLNIANSTVLAAIGALNDLSSAELAIQLGGLNDLSTADLASTPMTVSTSQLPPQIKKNTALAGFTFYMVQSVDNITPATGLTITGQVSIDAGAFGALTNNATEISAGVYTIDLDATDLNGDTITLKFTATGANAEIITIITQ